MSLKYISAYDEPTRYGIWEIEESLDYFQSALMLSPNEHKECSNLPDAKKLEWLATRYLLAALEGSTPRKTTSKTASGKPVLDQDRRFISLSHSHQWVSAMISSVACGIDIQKIVPKITRIATKFLSDEEWAWCPENTEDQLLYLHAIWGAKEALYKAYGLRQLDFREHIHISDFTNQNTHITMKGEIRKLDKKVKYALFCRQINEYVLVYGWEV